MKFSFLSLLLGLALLSSCGDDAVECDVNSFNNQVQSWVADLNTAVQAYANEQTEENCNAWKDAANTYLDQVQDFSTCDQFDQGQYNAIV